MRFVACRFARGLFSLFVSGSVLYFAGWRVDASIGTALQMQLGNPSNATADTNNHDHYLIQRSVEALDYSDNLREPSWVSWDLTASDLGTSGRSSSFFLDINLPSNFYRVQPTDYSGSGYDRGHLCPSGDRTDQRTDNALTFYMSNIIPQTADNNQGVWANLENYCRTLAQSGHELLIICGPGGFSSARINAAGAVYIPGYVWKIIVVVPPGSGPALSRISYSTRVIAVKIPNIAGVRSVPWSNYVTSVNLLQTNTGLTFFAALPPALAAVLRARVDGAPADGITSFTPTSGSGNTSVVISGTNLNFATAVMFNGTTATYTVNSGNQITATVPSGATTGPIAVMTPGGLATSAASFTATTAAATVTALTIARSNASVIISWPSAATGYSLQQNYDVNTTHWSMFSGPVSDDGATRSVTLSSPTGNGYFRLILP